MTRVALQLYTVRAECELDLDGVLGTAARLGYDGVELVSLHGRDARELRVLLDGHGLVVAGRHVALDADVGAVAAEQEALGCDRVALAWIDPPANVEERDDAVARVVELGERARAHGLRFGFHNHWSEVRRFEDGASLLERLPDWIWLELDLGWAWHAGVPPTELLDWAQGRTPLVHVKDLRSRETHEFVPVGDGGVGYAAVVPRAAALGVEWLVVEQDELDRTFEEALARSLAAVRDALGAAA